MVQRKWVFKYFFILVVCLFLFIGSGFFLNSAINRTLDQIRKQNNQTLFEKKPPLFIPRIILRYIQSQQITFENAYLSLMQDLDTDFPFDLCLLDLNGQILHSDLCINSDKIEKLNKDPQGYLRTQLKNLNNLEIQKSSDPSQTNAKGEPSQDLSKTNSPSTEAFAFLQMPPLKLENISSNHFMKNTDDGGQREAPLKILRSKTDPPNLNDLKKNDFLISFHNHRNLFIYLSHKKNAFPHPFPEPPPWDRNPLLSPLFFLFISLIVGAGAAVTIISQSIRKRVLEADEVLNELQKGNLKARFNITKSDEFGHAMKRFNFMADKIESLVENLKRIESTRNRLLQELAHDLRTPIAALKNLQETILYKGERLNESTRKEFIELSLTEIDYFERLVEDLLLLARIEDPRHQLGLSANSQEFFNFSEFIENEIQNWLTLAQSSKPELKIEIENQLPQNLKFPGSSHLIQRALRNSFENSLFFSKENLKIKFSLKIISPSSQLESPLTDPSNTNLLPANLIQTNFLSTELVCDFMDDGPGFTQEQIKNFGEKKFSRELRRNSDHQRLSVGLGSVVMKRICELYQGELNAENWSSPTAGFQSGSGAHIRMSFRF